MPDSYHAAGWRTNNLPLAPFMLAQPHPTLLHFTPKIASSVDVVLVIPNWTINLANFSIKMIWFSVEVWRSVSLIRVQKARCTGREEWPSSCNKHPRYFPNFERPRGLPEIMKNINKSQVKVVPRQFGNMESRPFGNASWFCTITM